MPRIIIWMKPIYEGVLRQRGPDGRLAPIIDATNTDAPTRRWCQDCGAELTTPADRYLGACQECRERAEHDGERSYK